MTATKREEPAAIGFAAGPVSYKEFSVPILDEVSR